MRVLALVLVLANLAYFLWNVQRGDAGPLPSGPPSGESAADRLPGAARLRLLSEAPGVEEGGSRAPGSEARVRTAAHCERLQVATDAAMAALLSALDAAGIDHRPLPGDGVTALRREQLYVPALASVAEARALVGELAAAGIDAYVMGRDEIDRAVSVGLYTDPVRAEERRTAMARMGHAVRARPVGDGDGALVIEVRAPAAGAIDAALAAVPIDPERSLVPCEAMAP